MVTGGLELTRLPKAKWDQLDDLLGEHGFGGYYDLVETLKDLAGQIGLFMTGLDSQNLSLPEIVYTLRSWCQVLSSVEGFEEIVDLAVERVEVKDL